MSGLLLNAGAVYDVKVNLGESQAPSWEPFGKIHKIGDSIEGVVVSAYRKTIDFEVRAKEKY